jgi:hypothetical protein
MHMAHAMRQIPAAIARGDGAMIQGSSSMPHAQVASGGSGCLIHLATLN